MSSSDESKTTTLGDIMIEIHNVKEQNNNIVTQNNEIKDELIHLKRDFDIIMLDINKSKSEISTVIQTPEFQAKQFDTHKTTS